MENDTPRRMPNVPPFVKFVCANVPMVFDDSLSYYEALCALWKYIQGMTDVINNNATLEEEFIEKFKELEKYVNDYFDNLDVQKEIDHKLDEMVEDGTLQEIIINYLQTKAMLVFDTVADMKLATDLVAGSYVRTLGYYSAGDAGGAIYKISDTGTANEKNVIAVGDLYAILVYGKNINVKQFGAKGDGIQDDTAYIQAALDALVTNGSLYFPKGYNYLTSDTLNLSADDVCLYSEPKTEYSTKITGTAANTTIMNISGYGVTVKNLAFYGDGDQDNFATIDGLNFDRTPVGDDETYSNIDCVVEECLFMHLDSCITVKGRNARIKNNTFTESKNGIVGLLHKYSSETETSELRGFFIMENVFHSMNFQTNATSGKTLETMDSFCISMPMVSQKVGNLQISDNKAENCGSIFYKGYLPCAMITDNYINFSIPTFIYSPVTDAELQDLSTRRIAQISNNYVVGRTDETFDTNFIVAKKCSNLNVNGNIFRTCNADGIVCEDTPRLYITNNFIINCGTANSNHSGIKLSGSGDNFVKNNIIAGFNKINYGISCTTQYGVELDGNIMSGVITSNINVAGDKIRNDLNTTAWATPSLINSFTFGSTFNQGYRKLENGKIEIQVELKGGTNNSNAFQLPNGFKPSRNFVLTSVAYNPAVNTSVQAYARFYTSGDVKIGWSGNPSSNDSFIVKTIFD